jgi:hypothetical protein
MTFGRKAALLVSGLALIVSPAAAFASGSPSDATQPGPGASPPAKAKAYGRYCQNQNKKHVAGTPGTAFSQCVTAMAKLAHGSTSSPRTACAALSKQHVAGQRGTPFSNCVAGGAKLLKDQKKSP